MEELESAVFYTDLDTIFDTRLAVLAQFGTEVVDQNLANGYFERNTDEFVGVDPKVFKEAYEKRDVSIFKDMILTGVMDLIMEFSMKTLVAISSSPLNRQPKLVVNTYPYKLSDEAIAAITQGLVSVTRGLISIELEEIPLEEITPDYVKKNYITMCVYHFTKWLDIQGKNFAHKQCPQVALLAPEIYSSKEDLKLVGSNDPRRMSEAHLSPFIKLLMFPSAIFSVDLVRMLELRNEQKPQTEKPSQEKPKRDVV